MATWGDLIELPVFTCPDANTGKFSNYIALEPREKAHVFIARIDLDPTEPWILKTFGSPDQVLEPDLSGLSWQLKFTRLKKDWVMSGPVNFRLFIQNADGSPVDIPSALVSYKLGGA